MFFSNGKLKQYWLYALNNPKHSLTKPISSRDGILLGGAKYGGGDGGAAAAAKSAFSLQADIQNDDAPHSSSLIWVTLVEFQAKVDQFVVLSVYSGVGGFQNFAQSTPCYVFLSSTEDQNNDIEDTSTMRTNLVNWSNLVSISKNVVFYALGVLRIY